MAKTVQRAWFTTAWPEATAEGDALNFYNKHRIKSFILYRRTFASRTVAFRVADNTCFPNLIIKTIMGMAVYPKRGAAIFNEFRKVRRKSRIKRTIFKAF